MNRSFWPTSTDAPSPSRTMPCSSVTRITFASRSTHSEIPGGVAAPSTTPRSPLNVFDPASTVVQPGRSGRDLHRVVEDVGAGPHLGHAVDLGDARPGDAAAGGHVRRRVAVAAQALGQPDQDRPL